jgi:lipopolysaccharide export system permease protein
MYIFGWLLTKMMLTRFIMILFSVVVFVLTLDIITYSDQVLTIDPAMMKAIGQYALHRAPELAGQFTVISILIAALLALGDVSRHSELVAVWNAGVSQWRIISMLAPVAIIVSVFHFMLVDQAAPRAAPQLHKWAIGDYSSKQLSVSEKDPIWMRAGRDILRAAEANAQATKLRDVIIFRRDKSGLLIEQIVAERADLMNKRWVLHNAVIYYRDDQPPNRIKLLIYSGPLRPAAAGTRSGDPAEMSIADLSFFIKNAGFGIRPKYVYSTWWHRRVATFFVATLMLLIAVPLAHRYRRGGGIGPMFLFGVAFGFGFFIFDGISLTMGELGLLAPWIAAWIPVVTFGAAAGTMIFRQETL